MTSLSPQEPIELDSYVPLRVQVYKALRDAIVSGRLKRGERIVEDKICSELGVSRSPLREALRKLEGEGLVTILPRRGAVVTDLSQEDLRELFDVREVLEGLSASLAAALISPEELDELDGICAAMEKGIRARDIQTVTQLNGRFHELITKASRNRWIRDFMTSIRAQTQHVYRSSIENPARAPGSVAEHRAIVQALREHDSQRAEMLARQHVQSARSAAIPSAISRAGQPSQSPQNGSDTTP
jgi:DNA-binding GntR family transcriptional regulator